MFSASTRRLVFVRTEKVVVTKSREITLYLTVFFLCTPASVRRQAHQFVAPHISSPPKLP